jgi:hypothetical protein
MENPVVENNYVCSILILNKVILIPFLFPPLRISYCGPQNQCHFVDFILTITELLSFSGKIVEVNKEAPTKFCLFSSFRTT